MNISITRETTDLGRIPDLERISNLEIRALIFSKCHDTRNKLTGSK